MDKKIFKKYIKNKGETQFLEVTVFWEKNEHNFKRINLKLGWSPITMKIYKWSGGIFMFLLKKGLLNNPIYLWESMCNGLKQ